MSSNKKIDVSIIIPLKNEEDSIEILATEISKAFEGHKWNWECIWIDDGSTDSSLSKVRTIHEQNNRFQYISLDRNFGQAAALKIGFEKARGDILCMLDSDLQNDPADLPRLISELESSDVDMVNGIRVRRQDNLIRLISSRIANGFRNLMTGTTVVDVGCSIRAFYPACIEGIPEFKGMHRFLPTLAKLNGARMKEIPVNHRQRKYGTTKYGINNRLWVGLLDIFGIKWFQIRRVHASIKSTSLASGTEEK